MHSNLLLALCLLAFVAGARCSPKDSDFNYEKRDVYDSSNGIDGAWTAFKIEFEKSYEESVDVIRKNIFAENLKGIEDHNRHYSAGRTTFTVGINPFSDMEISEFVKRMTGYRSRNSSDKRGSPTVELSRPATVNKRSRSEGVDWRNKGYVTPVKTQGGCNSGWAFSAIGALEGQHFRKTDNLVALSVQQLIDCSTANKGCNGGSADKAFEYMVAPGVNTEASYPYEGVTATCRFNAATVGAKNAAHADLKSGDEAELKDAVDKIGPISVAVDANHQSFRDYASGVYDEPACSSTVVTHYMLVVGYGKTATGTEYWIVKNSWGAQWGIQGYMWMSRNKNNQCGIATDATYPKVV